MNLLNNQKFQRIATVILTLILVLVLCSCGSKESEADTKKEEDALLKYMDGYNEGYDTGYYEGYTKGVQDIYNQLSEAGYHDIVEDLKKIQQ